MTYTVQSSDFKVEIEHYDKEQIQELLGRVRTGNDKVIAAWERVKAMPNGDAWQKALSDWHKATFILKCYCDQLQMLGYSDCLYLENKVKTRKCLQGMGCLVCPSKISYWEKEWEELRKEAKGG